MNPPEKRTESIRVSVTPELRQAIKDLAERRDVSEAHIVRRALRLYLKSQEGSTE